MKGKSENGRLNDSEHLSLNKRNDFKCALLQAGSDRSLIQNPSPKAPHRLPLRARRDGCPATSAQQGDEGNRHGVKGA